MMLRFFRWYGNIGRLTGTMRVAIDLTALNDNFSGIERYALNMTLEILKQNKDILVLEDGGSEIVNFDSKEGIVVTGTSNYICHGKILK